MSTRETVTETLNDFYQPSRPSKDLIDAKVFNILSEVGDGQLSGSGAFQKIALLLMESYGSPYSARSSATALLADFKIPFEAPEDHMS